MSDYNFYVYILSSESGTLYTGITNNLYRRLSEHKQNLVKGFTEKYNCHKLVYYEHYTGVVVAIGREKQLKKWNRIKKQNLIKSINPQWNDLSREWV